MKIKMDKSIETNQLKEMIRENTSEVKLRNGIFSSNAFTIRKGLLRVDIVNKSDYIKVNEKILTIHFAGFMCFLILIAVLMYGAKGVTFVSGVFFIMYFIAKILLGKKLKHFRNEIADIIQKDIK